jgi:hypothetical protein
MRIKKLAIAVSFHYAETRLEYLQKIYTKFHLLADEFAQDKSKNIKWNAFFNKNQLGQIQLNELLIDLRSKLGYLFIKGLK